MKRILMSLLTIGLVASVAFGATIAQLDDTETVPATFSVGTLNLQVGADDPTTVHLNKDNIAPGDAPYGGGYTGLWNIENTGTIDGRLSFDVTNLVNYENVCIEPELNDPGDPDSTCGNPGPSLGELGEYLHVTVVVTDPDGVPTKVWPIGVAVETLNSTAAMGPVVITGDHGLLEAGETGQTLHFKIVPLDSGVSNIVQSDSVEFDVVFTLVQE